MTAPADTIRQAATHSRFDRDPEALAWARAKVQHEIDRLTRWRDQAAAEGKTDQSKAWRRTASIMSRHLLGDVAHDSPSCVVAAFDERLPDLLAALEGTDPTTSTPPDHTPENQP